MECTLCNKAEANEFSTSGKKYYECKTCGLIFLDPEYHLTKEAEQSRYSYHQNFITDSGYVKFLGQIIDPALKYINADMQGLDFGCGPNPVLSQIMEKQNIKCDFYDLYFYNEINIKKEYDYIFATECFEHFFNPGSEINLIYGILKTNGILAIMTEFYPDIQSFPGWYYIKDPTHVCFYNDKVFDFVGTKYNMEKIFTDNKRVIIFQKL